LESVKTGAAFDGEVFVKKYLTIADSMPTFGLFMSANQQRMNLEDSILREGSKNAETLTPERKAILEIQKTKFEELSALIKKK